MHGKAKDMHIFPADHSWAIMFVGAVNDLIVGTITTTTRLAITFADAIAAIVWLRASILRSGLVCLRTSVLNGEFLAKST